MGALTPYTMVAPLFTELVLRGVDLVLFGALALKNRRAAE